MKFASWVDVLVLLSLTVGCGDGEPGTQPVDAARGNEDATHPLKDGGASDSSTEVTLVDAGTDAFVSDSGGEDVVRRCQWEQELIASGHFSSYPSIAVAPDDSIHVSAVEQFWDAPVDEARERFMYIHRTASSEWPRELVGPASSQANSALAVQTDLVPTVLHWSVLSGSLDWSTRPAPGASWQSSVLDDDVVIASPGMKLSRDPDGTLRTFTRTETRGLLHAEKAVGSSTFAIESLPESDLYDSPAYAREANGTLHVFASREQPKHFWRAPEATEWMSEMVPVPAGYGWTSSLAIGPDGTLYAAFGWNIDGTTRAYLATKVPGQNWTVEQVGPDTVNLLDIEVFVTHGAVELVFSDGALWHAVRSMAHEWILTHIDVPNAAFQSDAAIDSEGQIQVVYTSGVRQFTARTELRYAHQVCD